MINQRKKFIIFVYYYLPVVFWMGLIFCLSAIPGLRSGASLETEIFLRKTAHLFEYSVLAVLVLRAFSYRWKTSFSKLSRWTIFVCLLYAISDESHQFFVQDRSGRFLDVFVDIIGGGVGIIFYNFISKIKGAK